jgi:predicted NBD/HSP70 family sugar kinase/predicted transcriptional regulator
MTMHKGSNLERVGRYNLNVVLDLIRRSVEGLSRVQLVESTGLSTQTVSNIVRRLLEEGLIAETGKVAGRMGKPRTLLRIEALSRYAVGVHLDPSIITCTLLDLSGAVVGRSHIPLRAVADPDQTVRVIAEALESLVAEHGVDRAKVLGVGVAAPGPMDPSRGVVIGPPLLTGWERVDLCEGLSEATRLPVFLDKDSSAAAQGEVWIGDDATPHDFAFVYIGTGLGSGLVINSEVVRGTSNNVGEIGHFSAGIDGPVCSCGRPGCVGLTTMPSYLVSCAVEAGVLDPASGEPDLQVTMERFRALASKARQGNDAAVGILRESATRLARAVEDIANLLDLDRIVFGGPSWPPVSSLYLPVMREALANRMAVGAIHPLDLVDSALAEDVAAVGAGCLVLNRFLSPRTDGLLLAP